MTILLSFGLLLAVLAVTAEVYAEGSPRQQQISGDTTVSGSEQMSEGDLICLRGLLTDEGIECPALRNESQALYTLAGEMAPFEVGDDVCVCGTVVEVSFCMQGTTIAVMQISPGEQGCPP